MFTPADAKLLEEDLEVLKVYILRASFLFCIVYLYLALWIPLTIKHV